MYSDMVVSPAPSTAIILASMLVMISILQAPTAGNFFRDFEITWGDGRAKILENGELLTLSLDKTMGLGFRSKNEYLFGTIDMRIKLVPGNSAGTVTTYYMRSEGTAWNEIDFELLGNLSGEPYTVHTNVYTQGKGDREQQFHLWFDPAADFHTYSVLWNPKRIIFFVDGTPIRELKNLESIGVTFPKAQPMRVHSSLWNADDWATRGGRVKTDWTQAPFTASYSSSKADADAGSSQELDSTGKQLLRWVRKNHMIYDYCTDARRIPGPGGAPPQCNVATSAMNCIVS